MAVAEVEAAIFFARVGCGHSGAATGGVTVAVISKLGCGRSCCNGCTMAWLGLASASCNSDCSAMAVAEVEAAMAVL
jgi:hypothetical protein